MEAYLKLLNEVQLANLLYHVERGTTILCGTMSSYYVDGQGGAWPAVLACTRVVPTTEDDDMDQWREVIALLGGKPYLAGLKLASQQDVRAAILNLVRS